MPTYALEGVSPELPEDPDDVFVAPGAQLMGRVILRPQSSVWYNAVLRGDNEPITIGRGSNVQDGSVFHTDPGKPLTVGENVTVGHMALLHGCEIGDGCLVGMGAMVMNGAKVGASCLIGAGALVTEGKEIPPRSLVLGRPGKVVRELDDATVASLLASAERYRAQARRHREGLSAPSR